MAAGTPRTTVAARLRSLAWDRRGAVAIEFGFVAIPLVATIFGVIVTGMNFGEVGALEAASRHAAREMQLGKVVDIGNTTIRNMICADMVGLVPDCQSALQIYVKSGTTFAAIPPATFSGTTMSPTTYDPGTNGSYMVLQVAYVTSMGPSIFGTTGLLGPLGLRINVSPFLIASTVVFRNEPAAATGP